MTQTKKPLKQKKSLQLNFSLEMVLESKSEVDDNIVETYREYEIYKDENGQELLKKSQPPSMNISATKNKKVPTQQKTIVILRCQAHFIFECIKEPHMP